MVVPTCRVLKSPVAAIALCLAVSGCQALSPQQLWKLNRQPNMDRGDAYFSIPAEVDAESDAGDVVGELEAPDLSPSTSA